MRPDFKNIELIKKPTGKSFGEWEKETGLEKSWKTPEQIMVKPIYGPEDLADMDHLNYAAGLPPFLRGPYSTMYVMNPWTVGNMQVFQLPRNPMRFIAGT